MRAQRVRRSVGIANALLLLACGGAAAWYVLEVKPALAAGATSPEWLTDASRQYEEDKRRMKPVPLFPLEEGELDIIRRPDLAEEAGVWSYVGPVPVPLPKGTVAVGTAPPPEGLDALGKPHLVIVHAGEKPSMVAWRFTSNRMGYFPEGAFIREGKTSEKRFRLIDVLVPDPKVMAVSLVYDVYEDPTKPPIARKTSGPYDLARKFHSTLIRPSADVLDRPLVRREELPPSARPDSPLPANVPFEQVRPTIRPVGNDVEIEFDDAAWEIVRNLAVEDVLGKLRTEDVIDRKNGQRTGVRIADTGGVASAFDVENGDILKSVDGVRVSSREEAVKVVKGLPKGATIVSVVVERNGTERTYRVDVRDPKVRAAANKLRIGK